MRIKMDDARTGRNKNMAINSTSQFHSSRDSNQSFSSVSTSSSNNILSTTFLNLHKVPDLVNVSKYGTLPYNGLLDDNNSDIISPSALDKYIPQECDSDLIQEDLTDDDRRLAAALVAAQFVNQQKNQTGNIIPMLSTQQMQGGSPKLSVMSEANLSSINQSPIPPPLIGPNKGSNNTTAASFLVSGVPSLPPYNTANTSQLIVGNLPMLKRAVIQNRYLQSDELSSISQANIPLESLGIQTEMSAMDMDAEDIKHDTNIDFILPDDSKYTFYSEDSDGPDSDYNTSQQSRRQSLPHKKRLPRRLRNPKKPSNTRNSRSCINRRQDILAPMQNFTCELCLISLPNQWKFFEHLKSHYEPIQLEPSPLNQGKQSFTDGKQITIVTDSVKEMNKTSPPSPPQRSTTNRTSPPMPGLIRTPSSRIVLSPRSSTSISEVSKVVYSEEGTSIIRLPPSSSRQSKGKGMSPFTKYLEDSIINDCLPSPSALTNLELPSTSPVLLHVCEICKRAFRRLKAYEVHMATSHLRAEPVEEFSEPEDMMEGIRVSVVSDEEDSLSLVRDAGEEKDWYEDNDIYGTDGLIKVAEEEHEVHDDLVSVSDLGPLSINSVSSHHFSNDNGNSAISKFCGICKKTFSSRDECSQHISDKHGDLIKAMTQIYNKPSKKKIKKSALTCLECGKKFVHRNSYKYHIRSHQGRRPYNCDECGKRFFAKNVLKVHLRRHSGIKPYKCEFCDRMFRQWGDLKYHVISIHTNQKNYQCEICGKDFARKYSLTLHSRIHTGERNYKCEYCDKTFRASSYLLNHRKIHTGEKPHKCDICERSFRVKSDMNRHRLTHKSQGGGKRRTTQANNLSENVTITINSSPNPAAIYEDKNVISNAVGVNGQINLSDICKVEHLEPVTVAAVRTVHRLEGSLGAGRNTLVDSQKEQNGVYYWHMFPSN